jgi:hypothetical protein
MRFLAIFQVSKEANGEFSEEVIQGFTQIRAGDWSIKAVLAPGMAPLLGITDSEGTLAFTSHGDAVTLQGKSYEGNIEGSAKIAEVVNGKVLFSEAGDVAPEAMQQAILLRQQSYPKHSVSAIR